MNQVVTSLEAAGTPAGSVEKVYDTLRREIICMTIAPSTDLDEKTLVDRFGVSRTPVREALIRLAAEGLVEIKRNRGASVSELGLATLQSIFEAGDLIERAIARLACLRRTEADLAHLEQAAADFEVDMQSGDINAMALSNSRLHLLIAEASKNKYFVDSYRRILADHERIAQFWYAANTRPEDGSVSDAILKQHRELVRAIRDKDQDAAEAVTIAHADLCKDGIRELLASGENVVRGLAVERR